jgi:LuxR family transcriptional regulator, maltose regulon positive regulatory protein
MNDMSTHTEAAKPIRVYTLGRFEVTLDGVPLRFVFKVPRKPLALLKALLSGGHNGVSQSSLCATIWPDLEPVAAARALHITAFRLRGLLGKKTALIVQEGKVSVDTEQCWVDAWEFEQSLLRTRDPTETLWALRHYRGVFLGDSDHPLAVETRDRLSCKFIRSVSQLGASYERIGDTQSAIDLYLMALDAEGSCEDLHQSLMRCLASEGQASAVAAAYHRCRSALQRQFGTEPSAATERIYQDACVGGASDHAAEGEMRAAAAARRSPNDNHS